LSRYRTEGAVPLFNMARSQPHQCIPTCAGCRRVCGGQRSVPFSRMIGPPTLRFLSGLRGTMQSGSGISTADSQGTDAKNCMVNVRCSAILRTWRTFAKCKQGLQAQSPRGLGDCEAFASKFSCVLSQQAPGPSLFFSYLYA
jgi:hypothetical protein